jgi:NADP-dependent 3-hydroxy acid dehydrogenase YdfG
MVRTAVVTGASGGIGAAVVRAMAGRGDTVLAVGRDPDRLDSLCADAPGSSPVVMDLRDPTDLPQPLAELDRLDLLVHCAGVAEVAAVAETSYELWQETLLVNVAGAAELTRALLPALRRAAGRVVFINAAPGLHAVPRWSAYAASKVALRELADSLRAEEAGHGVRVTTIYPGGTATELLQKVRREFGKPYDPAACLQPATLAELVLATIDAPGDAHITELSVLPPPAVQQPEPVPVSGAQRRLTGRLVVPLPPDRAFRLFTPRGEQDWVPGWHPHFPTPAADDTVPGTVFQTNAHGRATTWMVVDRIRPRRIRYARVIEGSNAGTVTVTLDGAGEHTDVTVVYELTALSEAGSHQLAEFATGYPAFLQSWQDTIAAFLRPAG